MKRARLLSGIKKIFLLGSFLTIVTAFEVGYEGNKERKFDMKVLIMGQRI